MVDAAEDEQEDETAAAVDRFGLAGFVLEQKYRVDRVVAEGGFAVVYQGTHLRLERTVAVKVLKVQGDVETGGRDGFVDRFVQEARTVARLDHPAIVKVIDFGAADAPSGDVAPWMVLEWIEGVTLDRHLRTRRGRGGRRPSEVLALLRPALEALAEAHDLGIAHRDLKPANMMLVQGRRGARVKLLDFGIAKLMGDGESAGSGATRTSSSLQAFSPRYAAPEQCSSTRTGPWTDVHAVGLVLVEALTDRAPYPGSTLAERLSAAFSPDRPTPARRGVDVGPWEAVLARALALNPAERFPHAGDLLAALEAAVAPADAAWTRQASQRIPGLGVEASQPIAPEDTTLSGSAVSSQVPTAPPPAPPTGLAARRRVQRQALWTVAGASVTLAVSVGVLQFFPARRATPAVVPVTAAAAMPSPAMPAPAMPAPAMPSSDPLTPALPAPAPAQSAPAAPTADAGTATPSEALAAPSTAEPGRRRHGHDRARRVRSHRP
jgi:serine/threonine protein kinase